MFSPEEQAKLFWRCRRGMLELDAILIPFFKKHFSKLNKQQQSAFAMLLEQEDQDLYRWFLGYDICENPTLVEIIKFIRQQQENFF